MSFEAGTFRITNFKCGSALDLSAGDNKSIIGFPAHSGDNQQWEISPLGGGWMIRNVSTGDHLTTELGTAHGLPLIANAYPVAWVIERELEPNNKNVFRIMWPNTRLNVDLEHGNSTPGTKVHMWEKNDESPHQKWVFERCCSSESTAAAGATTTTTTTTTVTTTTVTTTTS